MGGGASGVETGGSGGSMNRGPERSRGSRVGTNKNFYSQLSITDCNPGMIRIPGLEIWRGIGAISIHNKGFLHAEY